jgi:uncharacterized protein (DUF2252 family)
MTALANPLPPFAGHDPNTPPPHHLPRADREAFGRSLRDRVRRVDHDKWVDDAGRDPVSRVLASEQGRLSERLPFRHGRMATTPFGFLRGGAWVMAPDLASLPHTNYNVQICGDAHVRNLGAFATPEGRIIFDLNDFDETCRAPWEWDLKRLAISIVLVGREGGTSDKVAKEAVMAMVRIWRESLHELADLPVIEVAKYTVHRFSEDSPVGRVLHKAERMSPHVARDELTTRSHHDGTSRFVDEPPKLTRCSELETQKVLASFAEYRTTLGPNRQLILDQYKPYDVASKLAGTGSVGCHNYAVMCVGNGVDDPLVLQVKEALPSCFRAQGLLGHDPQVSDHDGKRVAEGQHRMQTWTDPMLGWTTIDGAPYYVRQLSDHKAAIDPADLKRSSLVEYSRVCGETFAKAHARTADAAVLWGYAGQSDKLDKAFATMAVLGADQVTRDWEALVAAIAAGKIAAVEPA